MPNLELVNFIKKARQHNYTDEEIKKMLLDNNWTEEEIKDAFQSIDGGASLNVPSKTASYSSYDASYQSYSTNNQVPSSGKSKLWLWVSIAVLALFLVAGGASAYYYTQIYNNPRKGLEDFVNKSVNKNVIAFQLKAQNTADLYYEEMSDDMWEFYSDVGPLSKMKKTTNIDLDFKYNKKKKIVKTAFVFSGDSVNYDKNGKEVKDKNGLGGNDPIKGEILVDAKNKKLSFFLNKTKNFLVLLLSMGAVDKWYCLDYADFKDKLPDKVNETLDNKAELEKYIDGMKKYTQFLKDFLFNKAEMQVVDYNGEKAFEYSLDLNKEDLLVMEKELLKDLEIENDAEYDLGYFNDKKNFKINVKFWIGRSDRLLKEIVIVDSYEGEEFGFDKAENNGKMDIKFNWNENFNELPKLDKCENFKDYLDKAGSMSFHMDMGTSGASMKVNLDDDTLMEESNKENEVENLDVNANENENGNGNLNEENPIDLDLPKQEEENQVNNNDQQIDNIPDLNENAENINENEQVEETQVFDY